MKTNNSDSDSDNHDHDNDNDKDNDNFDTREFLVLHGIFIMTPITCSCPCTKVLFCAKDLYAMQGKLNRYLLC